MTHFLNSECIFEVIGNYPVVDQFDVLYTNLQSGSYTDDYVTGSMLIATANPNNVGFTYTQGNRGRAFSKLGIDQSTLPAMKRNLYRSSFEFQPFRERAGTVKNIKIFSNNERFYDSLLPGLNNYFEKLGGIIYSFSLADYFAIVIGKPPTNQIKPGQMVGFNQRFPFEPIFSSVTRTKRIDGFISTYQDTSGGSFSTIVTTDPIISKKIIIAEWNGLGASFGTTYWVDNPAATAAGVEDGLSELDISKILFGFGDRGNTQIDPTQIEGGVTGSLGLPVSRTAVNATYYYLASSPIIRGWKYGLVSGLPHYTSAVFRHDRYGQFRDMLEQRVYPATYVDYENSPTNYFGDYEAAPLPFSNIASQNQSVDYPVTVNFVRQTITSQGPQDSQVQYLTYTSVDDRNYTWSSNLDLHASSSLPFFDAPRDSVGKNRPEIPSDIGSAIFI